MKKTIAATICGLFILISVFILKINDITINSINESLRANPPASGVETIYRRRTSSGDISYSNITPRTLSDSNETERVVETIYVRGILDATNNELSEEIIDTCKVQSIGVNTDTLQYFSAEMPLKDLSKMSMGWIQPWGSSLKDVPLDLDENGYLKTVGSEGAQMIISDDNWGRSVDDNRYVVLYDGEGELSFNIHPSEIIKEESGRIEIELAEGRTGMKQLSTNPINYLRNIRIIPLENENDYEEIITRENFRDVWQGVEVMRYLNAQRINNSKEVEWSDRQKRTTFGSGKGQSLEDIIQMSNETNTNPWLLVPHLANDNYITEMAIYVRDNLNPNLKVYIEYTNEAWNWGFKQTGYLSKLADNNGTTIYQEYGLRAKQIFEIWSNVWGGGGRLVRVIGTHFYNPWVSDQIMQTPGLAGNVDALAVGYYVGGEIGAGKDVSLLELDIDGIFNYLNTISLPKTKEILIKQKEIAEKYNLELVAYEAGQHLAGVGKLSNDVLLADKFINANRDPRMQQVYLDMYNQWNEIGGALIVWFQTTGKPGKWGSWGLLENTSQNPQETPKYQAVKNMMSNHGC